MGKVCDWGQRGLLAAVSGLSGPWVLTVPSGAGAHEIKSKPSLLDSWTHIKCQRGQNLRRKNLYNAYLLDIFRRKNGFVVFSKMNCYKLTSENGGGRNAGC